ncbi:hypothetical protein ACFY1V_26460 [Streptomyces sp. NPDC001255]|uniref:hypothetical protein n=1 Tax=Streptomyces sp. NPDC001255 TaxID=3364550 RepID=UPI0036800C61
MTPHDAIVNNKGGGETVRSVDGGLERDGMKPGQRDSRINWYVGFAGILGTGPGAARTADVRTRGGGRLRSLPLGS